MAYMQRAADDKTKHVVHPLSKDELALAQKKGWDFLFGFPFDPQAAFSFRNQLEAEAALPEVIQSAPSPEPPAQPVKRGRGRPRKYPLE